MTFTGTLRPFQSLAVDRVHDQRRQLVAYQMGLGKTVVTICAVEELVELHKVQSGLVVVPASLKYQWARSIEQFTGDDNYIVIDGTPKQRAAQYERIRDKPPLYIILNYEKVRDEWPQVAKLPRDFVVTDEATVYKSFKPAISRRVKRLRNAVYFIGLTGQPIENRPEDLFSIMEAVDNTVLGRWDYYDKLFIVRDGFGRITRVKNLPLLWDIMEDSMVRKTRHDPDVAPYMPQVEETTIPVDFDPATAKVYREMVSDLKKMLILARESGQAFNLMAHYTGGDAEDMGLRGSIMAILTALRMLCDHPDLVRLSAELYGTTDDHGSEYAYEIVKSRGLLNKVERTPKLSAFLDGVLDNLREDRKTKVVVFSTFKPTLMYLQDALRAKNFESVLFNGDMSAKQKDSAKQRFATDPFCRVFLSSDAGGYGVDLPNANYLKNYDLPWSAGLLEQRNSRIIRLSSEFDKVHVENYVMRGSIEERQYRMLQQKLATAAAMVDQKGADVKGGLTMGLDTLSEFLDMSSV